jgi:hypothetical protein
MIHPLVDTDVEHGGRIEVRWKYECFVTSGGGIQMLFTEAYMARRMNWERAFLDRKRKQSVGDEREFMDKDLAAKWLERQEQSRWVRFKDKRKAASVKREPTSGSGAKRKGKQVRELLPWEGESEFHDTPTKHQKRRFEAIKRRAERR